MKLLVAPFTKSNRESMAALTWSRVRAAQRRRKIEIEELLFVTILNVNMSTIET